MLNGTPVNGIVDTGSTSVLVRDSVARKAGIIYRRVTCPLYSVGDVNQPSTSTIGEAEVDVTIDGVLAADHQVRIVSDETIPVNVLVGQTWLQLPHVHYYKRGVAMVFESNVTTEQLVPDEEVICSYIAEEQAPKPKQPITVDEIKIDASVTDQQRDDLMKLMNQYRHVFAKSLGELGCTDMIRMDISEVPNSVPVNARPYKTSPTDRRVISDILHEWKKAGIISDSTSTYASPVLLVNKASGEKILCVDYRKLNQQTVTHPFPMPDIDAQLGSLAHGLIFTTLDLSNGFLQIPLTDEAKDKTAFVTEKTVARFERMPFGLKGAPAVFQRLMSIVFKDLRDAGVVNTYLDDIIIPSRNWSDMLVSLRRAFEALSGAKLTLKPSKCTFGNTQLDYLGFRIRHGEIEPGQKIEAISDYPRPLDAHKVRRFLGLAGYFRRFIVKFAEIAEPLTLLTAKNAPYVWTDEHQSAFDDLKTKLCRGPIVRMYSSTAEITEVHTDASSKALSGVLLQGSRASDLKIVYAVSKRTTQPESNYHSSRLELYAIVWTINRLRPYLLGVRFTVVTDCQALTYLNINRTTKPQIARWFEVFQEFDFDVRYRTGSRMAHVDALSRAVDDIAPSDKSVESELAERLEVFTALTTVDRVRFMQQADDQTRKIIRLLESPDERTRGEEAEVNSYELHDGVLYRVYQGRALFVVPKSMRKGVVMSAHDYGGHFSVDKTVARITRDYWFSCMRRYVRQHIKMCLDCLTHQRPAGKQAGLLHPTPPGRRPFQIIHIDHLGPFETTTKRNRYLLVIVDNLTKYVHLYPCRTTDSVGVIRILNKFIDERGVPDRIISDRGTSYTSHAFERFCSLHSISHVLNSTRHPQAKGQVERANRTILPLLSISTTDQRNWDTKVREVERHLNSAMNKTTSKTPCEAL